MLHRLELARVGTHWAAWCADVDDPARERAAAEAKSFVPEAINFVTGEDIQIHGGVGFTWECDAHFLFKRAKQNDVLLGYQGWHRARVADLGPDSIVFELVGSPEDVDSFEELVRPHGLQELGRTGRIGLSRATRQPRPRSQQQVMA